MVKTSNWIEYNLNNHPLKDQTLTGNKFWDIRETEPLPTPKGPDLAILSAENWAFEDDGLVLQLLVKIANHGDTRANQTRVYAGDPQHDWPGRESVVPAFNPEETGTIEIRLDIPEEQRGTTHVFMLELEPAMRKIAYLYLGAYDPVHGEQIKDGQVTGEIVDGLNKVVSARHRRENAEKLQGQVTPLAHALLQQIIGSLRDELAPRDITITGLLEGGKITCQFIEKV